jgi:teichuronic acid biosynthesis glycosyltransferase TuaG
MPEISVITPYFNKINYIKKTINSVLNQTYKNFELIIIYDDKKNDDLKILNNFKKKDKRIKIIVNSKNIGAGLSRNKGIQNSSGKYIAFIDSDDLWKKDKLKKQLAFIKKNDILFCHTSYKILFKNKKISKTIRARSLNYNSLLNSCDIGLSTVMLNRKIINNNLFTKLKTKEDFVAWLSIAKRNINLIGLDKSLTIWVDTKNSLSKSVFQKLYDAFIVYKKYQKFNNLKALRYTIILSINFLIKRYYKL